MITETLFAPATFNAAVLAFFGLGAAVGIVLFFITAPYGRHSRPGWGPAVGARLGWIVMEFPAAVVLPALLLGSGRRVSLAALLLLVLWEIHYLQRTLVYPFLISRGSARVPLVIVAMGVVFNVFNGYIQGGWLFHVGPPYPPDWLKDPRFCLGVALFLGGTAINWHSDAVLRRLRGTGETGYAVPQGGLFRWISCPNYLGEMIEWMGWALATWSLPGAAFAWWTIANLAPRAMAHHRWYLQKFPEYPDERGAICPRFLEGTRSASPEGER